METTYGGKDVVVGVNSHRVHHAETPFTKIRFIFIESDWHHDIIRYLVMFRATVVCLKLMRDETPLAIQEESEIDIIRLVRTVILGKRHVCILVSFRHQ